METVAKDFQVSKSIFAPILQIFLLEIMLVEMMNSPGEPDASVFDI